MAAYYYATSGHTGIVCGDLKTFVQITKCHARHNGGASAVAWKYNIEIDNAEEVIRLFETRGEEMKSSEMHTVNVLDQ